MTSWTAGLCLQDLWPCTFSMPASRFSFFLDQTRGLLIFSKHQLLVSLIFSMMLPTAFDLYSFLWYFLPSALVLGFLRGTLRSLI